MATKNLGEDGFFWFLGEVVDRNDPLKQGRVRVRIMGSQGNEVQNPTNQLHWSPILLEATSPVSKQKGKASVGVIVGSTVIGFYMDGAEKTMPVVWGVLPGKNDTSQLAQGTNTLNIPKLGNQPEPSYRAVYPFNKVSVTESGHVVEVDDTPGAERVHVYHKSGTFIELRPNGDVLTKVIGKNYEVVQNGKDVFVKGSITLTATDGVTIKGNVNIQGTLTVSGIVKAPEYITG